MAHARFRRTHADDASVLGNEFEWDWHGVPDAELRFAVISAPRASRPFPERPPDALRVLERLRQVPRLRVVVGKPLEVLVERIRIP